MTIRKLQRKGQLSMKQWTDFLNDLYTDYFFVQGSDTRDQVKTAIREFSDHTSLLARILRKGVPGMKSHSAAATLKFLTSLDMTPSFVMPMVLPGMQSSGLIIDMRRSSWPDNPSDLRFITPSSTSNTLIIQ